MGTEIFKIEEKITEKMKPQIADPPLQKWAEFTSHNMDSFDVALYFHDLQWKQNLLHVLVEGKIKVVFYPKTDVSSPSSILP